MTLENMLESYGGGVCVTIEDGEKEEKYCVEEQYDYYAIPLDYLGNPVEDMFTGENAPSCIVKEPWWDKVKSKEVKHWNVIGGGIYKIELYITIE